MKRFFLLYVLSINILIYSQTLHSYKVNDIYGQEYDFSKLKGKKVMIVNTASKCGLTPQYEDLEKLYQKYKDNDFIIIAFPSSDFLNQEPGNNEEIASFCQKNYGVSFPIMEKNHVRGKEKQEVYKFLTSKELNKVENSDVKWNFQKFLIDENGKYVRSISPKTNPLDNTIIDWIENK